PAQDDNWILPSEDDDPEQAMINHQERQLIEQAIDGLPEKQRTAFVLSKYDDLPQREIAAIMNTSEGSVEQLLLRAKANLQKKLVPFYKKK
nr:sigma-70 family RNA polymerase sigma factor [Breznakibacter sp.]